jgi:hypothetical protein
LASPERVTAEDDLGDDPIAVGCPLFAEQRKSGESPSRVRGWRRESTASACGVAVLSDRDERERAALFAARDSVCDRDIAQTMA